MKRLFSRAGLCLLLAAAPAPLFAQSGLGSVAGTVVDESGGVIPAATVRLVETSTKATRTATSNEVGLFTIPSVPPGTYSVTVGKDLFKTKKIEGIVVNSFQQVALGRLALDVNSERSETVDVVAVAALLNSESGVRSESIQANQVAEMPLQGRNWASLLKVIPGSNPTNSSAFNGREYSATGYADFRINGKNPGQTQVNLDGGSLVDQGSDGKTTVAPSLESIQEVSVLTNNFKAEYGNRGGTVINIVTKSGSNDFHGAAFDYMRNDGLNANSFQNKYTGLPRPRYRYNYVGANLGGPIKKDKLFFFYNFENFIQDVPGAVIQGRVPTLLERQGDFSQTLDASGRRPTIFMPGSQASGSPQQITSNVLPKNLIDPLGVAILNLYPEPNNPGDLTNNYIAESARQNPRFSNALKLDWNVSEKTRAFGRLTADDGTQIDRSISATSGIFPYSSVKRPRPDRALSAGVTHVATPELVLDGLFAWSYDKVDWLPADPENLKKSTHGLSGLPTVFAAPDDLLPAMSFASGTFANFAFNRMPGQAIASEYQLGGTATWAHAAHVVKGGLQLIKNRKDETDQSENKGFYDFSVNTGSAFDTGYGPANVLVGALNQYRQIETVNHKHAVYNDVHFFLQDTWKVRKNITLDYGLRLYHIPTQYQLDPKETLDAAFVPSRWDPARAPRFYVPDPKNPTRVIDPARPNDPVPATQSSVLRYTIVPGSGDLNNGLVSLGDGGIGNPGIANPPFLLFAPRGGFAWSPTQQTVVRGGFGWAYNRENIAAAVNRFENVLSPSITLSQTSLGTLSSAGIRPVTPRATVGVRDESTNKKPTTYDYSVSVQQQLLKDFVLDVAYIGNQQKNQPIGFNINAIPLGTAFRPEFIDPSNAGSNFFGPVSATNPGALPGSNTVNNLLMRPYRGYDTLTMDANQGTVKYNGLQVGLRKRLSKGLAFQLSYTLGRTTGNVDTPGLYTDDWRAYGGYKLSTDRLHVLNINYTYDVPKLAAKIGLDNVVGRTFLDGWRIAHTFLLFSGQDFSPGFTIQQANTTTNVDLNKVLLGTPDLGPRVNVPGDPNALDRDFAHQFDPSQLGVPGIYPASDGRGDRNFVHGRGSFANDISLVKKFEIGGKHRGLELRANLYNVFNQTRLTGLNTSVQFKARGRTFADGFDVFNTPEQLEARAKANGVSDPTQLYNQYRTGVGHVNLTSDEPARIVEIGLAFRF
jgi:hypothetical protein